MSLATWQQLRSSPRRFQLGFRPRTRRLLTIGLAVGAVLVVALLIVVAFFIDPPLRTAMERRLNANLKGYTAELAELDFHPLGFGLTLEGLTIRQDKHPKPAVIDIPKLEASVEWKQLLWLRLVADIGIVQPKVHVDRTQFASEVKDPVPVEDKGWQEKVDATFQPLAKTAELDLDLAIEPTQLTTMNDMLRAFANFDVTAGSFAFYSKVAIHDGNVKGWVKPLFEDMNVYSPGQDGGEGLLHAIYENVLEGVKLIFENKDETVATETTITGRIENPQTSTLDILINLARNAFIRAILPGFESRVGRKAGLEDIDEGEKGAGERKAGEIRLEEKTE